jgi:hypothetical protein
MARFRCGRENRLAFSYTLRFNNNPAGTSVPIAKDVSASSSSACGKRAPMQGIVLSREDVKSDSKGHFDSP